jgi:ATP-dependent Zn protease
MSGFEKAKHGNEKKEKRTNQKPETRTRTVNIIVIDEVDEVGRSRSFQEEDKEDK